MFVHKTYNKVLCYLRRVLYCMGRLIFVWVQYSALEETHLATTGVTKSVCSMSRLHRHGNKVDCCHAFIAVVHTYRHIAQGALVVPAGL